MSPVKKSLEDGVGPNSATRVCVRVGVVGQYASVFSRSGYSGSAFFAIVRNVIRVRGTVAVHFLLIVNVF